MEERDFIGHCQTNIECLKSEIIFVMTTKYRKSKLMCHQNNYNAKVIKFSCKNYF